MGMVYLKDVLEKPASSFWAPVLNLLHESQEGTQDLFSRVEMVMLTHREVAKVHCRRLEEMGPICVCWCDFIVCTSSLLTTPPVLCSKCWPLSVEVCLSSVEPLLQLHQNPFPSRDTPSGFYMGCNPSLQHLAWPSPSPQPWQSLTSQNPELKINSFMKPMLIPSGRISLWLLSSCKFWLVYNC
jgi:hypothetical protein